MSRNATPRGSVHVEPVKTLPPCVRVDPPRSSDEAPVLRPTMEEFLDFEEFVKRARSHYGEYGLVKVIPPEEWKARKSASYDDVDSLTIPIPIKQVLQGTRGVYQQYNIEQKPLSVAEFREKATKVLEESKVAKRSVSERDRAYWRTVAFNPVLYGADMPGSLFDDDLQVWNLAKLPNLLSLLPTKLAGINDPYIYFGMWKAAFAWHVEDMELYSINYLHFGEPKAWYSVPQREMGKFEQAAATLFPEESRACKQFLRHKQSVISPTVLNGTFHVTIHTSIQHAGEFVITWPGAYHAGFNHGFNCAEAVNFALEDWIPWGQASKPCLCDAHRALINMDYFVYKFEVEKYGRPITNPQLDIARFSAPYNPSIAPIATAMASQSSSVASKHKATSNTGTMTTTSTTTTQKSKALTPRTLPPHQEMHNTPTSPNGSISLANPHHHHQQQQQQQQPQQYQHLPHHQHQSVFASTTSPPHSLLPSSPKKKITFKFVTVYEVAPRPQLIRAPVAGARVSPRFHPSSSSSSVDPRSSMDLKDIAPIESKKRAREYNDRVLTAQKVAKLSESMTPSSSNPNARTEAIAII